MPVPASRNKSITPPLLSFSYSAWWDKNKTLAISFVHMCHWGRTTPCQPEHSSSKAYFLPEHTGSNKENKSVSLSCSISGGGIYYTHEASLKASSHFPPLSLIHPNAAYAPSWQKPPINTCWGQRQAAESQRAPFPSPDLSLRWLLFLTCTGGGEEHVGLRSRPSHRSSIAPTRMLFHQETATVNILLLLQQFSL